MSNKAARILAYLEEAARDNFETVDLRTLPMTPELASIVVRKIPASDGLEPEELAAHLHTLPADSGECVRLQKTAGQTYLAVSIPGDRRAALEWANALLENLSAASVKMNLGPRKRTDLKVFWGKPDINTLIDIGGED